MGKRVREEPCDVCGHYHKYEEGEVCGICGHLVTSVKVAQVFVSSAPSPILPDFLYIGRFDDVSHFKTLKTLEFSHILNTVPSCKNLYPSNFTYYRLEDEKALEFDNAIKFLEECEKSKSRVLVHCMSGKSSDCNCILDERHGWRLAESYKWVKQCRPSTDISPEFQHQLKEFEERLFGSRDGYVYPELNNQHQDFAFGAVNDDLPMDSS